MIGLGLKPLSQSMLLLAATIQAKSHLLDLVAALAELHIEWIS